MGETQTPRRIQRQRTKGWKMPAGAVYVGRPSLWGNPFDVESCIDNGFAENREQARAVCTDAFRSWLREGPTSPWWYDAEKERHHHVTVRLGELRGRDLMCWCPLDQPCHADVLLELANAIARVGGVS